MLSCIFASLSSLATRWVDRWVPPGMADLQRDEDRRARLLVRVNLFVVVICPTYALIYLVNGLRIVAAIPVIVMTLSLISLVLLRDHRNVALAGNVLLTAGFIGVAFTSLIVGLDHVPLLAWVPLTPMLALSVCGRRSGIVWAGICLVHFGVVHVCVAQGLVPPAMLDFEASHWLDFLSWAGALLTMLVLLLTHETDKDAFLEALELRNNQLETARTELAETRDATEQANRAKSEFVANMSHEIRTPMNGVLGMTLLLREIPLSREAAIMVETIHGSGKALLAVIDDILDFSKIEAGRLELESAPFDPRRLVEDVSRILSGQATRKRIALQSELRPGLPACVMGDEARMRQVLLNLVGNGVKFTSKGHVKLSFRLADAGEGDLADKADGRVRLRFEVSDTGLGIASDKLVDIFQVFTQADSSMTRRFGGTGLGLAISSQLVELMGGKLAVDSIEGLGSTFYFELDFPLVEESNELASAPAAEPEGAERWPQIGAKVLVVEDNLVNQKVVQRLLQRLGCHVDLADNGRECLDRLAEAEYDVVLMDCQMPVMDGFEATRAIRESESEISRLPIVALTAHAMASDRERCEQAGMDDYITKPIDLKRLTGVLRRYAAAD